MIEKVIHSNAELILNNRDDLALLTDYFIFLSDVGNIVKVWEDMWKVCGKLSRVSKTSDRLHIYARQ